MPESPNFACPAHDGLTHIALGKNLERKLRHSMSNDDDAKEPRCWYEQSASHLVLKAGTGCGDYYREWEFEYDGKNWSSKPTIQWLYSTCDRATD